MGLAMDSRLVAVAGLVASLLTIERTWAQSAERPELSQGDSWVYSVVEGGTFIRPGNFASLESYTVTEVQKRMGSPSGYAMARTTATDAGGGATTSYYSITISLNGYARANARDSWQEAKWLQWPLASGARWKVEIPLADGVRVWEARVEGWEELDVPAGRFKAIRIVYDMVQNPNPLVTGQATWWYAPAVKACIKKSEYGQIEASMSLRRDTRELKSYQVH
jgi:hypothetical protein